MGPCPWRGQSAARHSLLVMMWHRGLLPVEVRGSIEHPSRSSAPRSNTFRSCARPRVRNRGCDQTVPPTPIAQHHNLLCRSASLQHTLGKRLRAQIAKLTIVRHHRSLDLLQCVLGFLGWSYDYQRRDPFLIMYSHILSAIVQNLRIDSPPPSRTPPVGSERHPMASVRDFQIKLPLPPERTMEERRALLSSYLVTAL